MLLVQLNQVSVLLVGCYLMTGNNGKYTTVGALADRVRHGFYLFKCTGCCANLSTSLGADKYSRELSKWALSFEVKKCAWHNFSCSQDQPTIVSANWGNLDLLSSET